MASKKQTTKKKQTRQRKSVKLKQPDKAINNLKPCPFCGGKAETYNLPWGAGVSCTNKLCQADGPTPRSEQITSTSAAAKLWNKRK